MPSLSGRLSLRPGREWLLVVCSGLLQHLPPVDGGDGGGGAEEEKGNDDGARARQDTAAVLDIVARVFRRTSAVNIQKVGLAYLARNLRRHPNLVRRYVPGHRTRLLSSCCHVVCVMYGCMHIEYARFI